MQNDLAMPLSGSSISLDLICWVLAILSFMDLRVQCFADGMHIPLAYHAFWLSEEDRAVWAHEGSGPDSGSKSWCPSWAWFTFLLTLGQEKNVPYPNKASGGQNSPAGVSGYWIVTAAMWWSCSGLLLALYGFKWLSRKSRITLKEASETAHAEKLKNMARSNRH